MTQRAWRWRLVALLGLLPALAGFGWFESADPNVERGTARYRAGDLRGAVAAYRAALRRGDAPAIHFNLGTALYRLAETAEGERRESLLDEAERSLRRAADADRPRVRAAAYFNLGHLLAARGRLETAAGAYRRALRAAPDYAEARYNLELVLRELAKRSQPAASRGDGMPPSDPPQGTGEPEQPSGEPAPPDGERPASPSPPSPARGDAPEVPPSPEDTPGSPRDSGASGSGAANQPASPPRRRSDDHKKLDALERRSRTLKVDRIRRSAQDGERPSADKDW